VRRLAITLAAACAALAAAAPAAQGAFFLEGLKAAFEADQGGSVASQAGTHPFAQRTAFEVNTAEDPVLGFEVPEEDFRDLRIDFPPGLVADRDATEPCSLVEFLPPEGGVQCPLASTVGTVEVENSEPGNVETFPVYNLAPPPGSVARLGFIVADFVPVAIDLGLSEQPPYHGVARLADTVQALPFYASDAEIWGVPAAAAHDEARGGAVKGSPRPFLTLPRACTGPLATTFAATTWQGSSFSAQIESRGEAGEPLGMRGCAGLGFAPEISAAPTTRSAASPSGLDFELTVADPGLANPEGAAASDIKKAVVALPEGMTLNPSQAEGLGTCSEADLAREGLGSAPGEGCPQDSKVGTVEVRTPLAKDETLTGSLYVAEPYANRFGSLIALFMTIESKQLGVAISLAGEVEPDPRSGRLIATFGGEGTEPLPQLPFSEFRVELREGARSPLVTPPGCGAHTVEATLHPWAGGSPALSTSSFEIDSGPGGSPCPAGAAPFEPGFEAGTLNNQAGAHSPFALRITRADGMQDLSKLSAVLPPGVLGKIAGIPWCPEAGIARAKSRTGEDGGQDEIDDPSCPAASLLGRTRRERAWAPSSPTSAGACTWPAPTRAPRSAWSRSSPRSPGPSTRARSWSGSASTSTRSPAWSKQTAPDRTRSPTSSRASR
jgi:hypothetical protein